MNIRENIEDPTQPQNQPEEFPFEPYEINNSEVISEGPLYLFRKAYNDEKHKDSEAYKTKKNGVI